MEDHEKLPVHNVAKCMTSIMNQKVGKRSLSHTSKLLMVECATEFLMFIASEAIDVTFEQKKKQLDSDHIMTAIRNLGFDDLYKTLEIYQNPSLDTIEDEEDDEEDEEARATDLSHQLNSSSLDILVRGIEASNQRLGNRTKKTKKKTKEKEKEKEKKRKQKHQKRRKEKEKEKSKRKRKNKTKKKEKEKGESGQTEFSTPKSSQTNQLVSTPNSYNKNLRNLRSRGIYFVPDFSMPHGQLFNIPLPFGFTPSPSGNQARQINNRLNYNQDQINPQRQIQNQVPLSTTAITEKTEGESNFLNNQIPQNDLNSKFAKALKRKKKKSKKSKKTKKRSRKKKSHKSKKKKKKKKKKRKNKVEISEDESSDNCPTQFFWQD
ncbi:ccaat-binding transcription factor-related [Anaeramoeba flamelloides]|uniref:Ccaat-binding transcription factor-related n=1 Tax=Anaeramoeba flamelloides TaxID=1746091 RepID=A0AAV8A8C8_9EUKA|nr:ccaat-binding transcription factor-related [Anaeramoeba flamelloides]